MNVLKQTLTTHQATLARKEAILGAAAKRDAAQLLIGREGGKAGASAACDRRSGSEAGVSHATLQTALSGLMTQGQTLASYGAGEIKTLLAEMLGIEHLKALSAKAGDVAKILGRALDEIQTDLTALAGKRQRKADVERSVLAQGELLRDTRAQRDLKLEEAAKLTQERATLAAKAGESATAEARLRELSVRAQELLKGVQTLGRFCAEKTLVKKL
ncbi:hypothetical protein LJR267_010590 [Paraburkholderia hospita]